MILLDLGQIGVCCSARHLGVREEFESRPPWVHVRVQDDHAVPESSVDLPHGAKDVMIVGLTPPLHNDKYVHSSVESPKHLHTMPLELFVATSKVMDSWGVDDLYKCIGCRHFPQEGAQVAMWLVRS